MVEELLAAVRADEALQSQMRTVTTSAGLAEVAKKAGLDMEAGALVKGFAQLLLQADNDLAARNFDNLGWDVGELLWALKTWELPSKD